MQVYDPPLLPLIVILTVSMSSGHTLLAIVHMVLHSKVQCGPWGTSRTSILDKNDSRD